MPSALHEMDGMFGCSFFSQCLVELGIKEIKTKTAQVLKNGMSCQEDEFDQERSTRVKLERELVRLKEYMLELDTELAQEANRNSELSVSLSNQIQQLESQVKYWHGLYEDSVIQTPVDDEVTATLLEENKNIKRVISEQDAKIIDLDTTANNLQSALNMLQSCKLFLQGQVSRIGSYSR